MRIFGATKKHALSRGTMACAGEVATLNVTRGCGASCVFCYARCYPGAPDAGTLLLYHELPRQLRQELSSGRRRRPLPRFVILGTACDPFLGGPEVAQVSRACIELLLAREIGVSFTTRGTLPDGVVDLLARHAALVRVTIPLPSLSDAYSAAWEPGAAAPRERLLLAQRLIQAGVTPWIRIEPIIPFVNDSTDGLRPLVSAIAGLGIDRATASFLQVRPGVTEQILREAPPETRRLVLGCFQSYRAGQLSGFDHLPPQQAAPGLRRVQRVARERNVRVAACACQNPGLPAGRCPVAPPELPAAPRGLQSALFGEEPQAPDAAED